MSHLDIVDISRENIACITFKRAVFQKAVTFGVYVLLVMGKTFLRQKKKKKEDRRDIIVQERDTANVI